MFIFPRVHFKDHFNRDGPPGCIGSAYPSGWMTCDNFLLFLQHSVKQIRSPKDNPVLLLLNNHKSHLSIEVLDYAKCNGIVMLSFPPHRSHKLQPLNRTVFGRSITIRLPKRGLSTTQENQLVCMTFQGLLLLHLLMP